MEADKLEYFKDLLSSCFVPELRQDLDSIPIDYEHFAEYRVALEKHKLPMLYDLIQQNREWIFNSEERDAQEISACLIVALCEMTAPTAIYKVNNEEMLKYADNLLRERVQANSAVTRLIFEHYQKKLRKDCWKRQVGAVHSFLKYLDVRYIDANNELMPANLQAFCLSIGLTVRECYDPTYKQIGVRLFQHILSKTNYSDIQNLNVHSVIYNDVLKDVHFMDSIAATTEIWNCLLKCLDYCADINSLNWSHIDDLMEILLRNVSLAPNTATSICLLGVLIQLAAYFNLNRQEIVSKLNLNFDNLNNVDECFNICTESSSYTSYRWAKNILNMFFVESYKLMQDEQVCCQLLEQFHKCYMICVLPIPLQIIEPHLSMFFEKFTSVLMEALAVHKLQQNVVKAVKCTISTFSRQLKNSTCINKSSKYSTIYQSFEVLLENKLFL